MTTAEVILLALLTLVGVGLSALFSGLETGLYTINRVRLTVRADADESHETRADGSEDLALDADIGVGHALQQDAHDAIERRRSRRRTRAGPAP